MHLVFYFFFLLDIDYSIDSYTCIAHKGITNEVGKKTRKIIINQITITDLSLPNHL